MRPVLSAIAVALLFATPTTTAASADGMRPWTPARAATTVRAVAAVRVPEPLRASLAADLRELVLRWRRLEALASEQDGESGGPMGSAKALSPVHHARYRLETALTRLREGLRVKRATCVGTGPAEGGGFGRFTCAVVSEQLQVPSPEIVWENDRIVGVRDNAPSVVGPYLARLDVRVTGRSTLAYRQVGPSTPAP